MEQLYQELILIKDLLIIKWPPPTTSNDVLFVLLFQENSLNSVVEDKPRLISKCSTMEQITKSL